jgi:hypothetical protein
MKYLSTAVSLTAIAMALCLAASTDASARERSRGGSWSNSHGASGTWNSKTQRSRGHFARQREWTGPRGGGSSSVERNWDREAGTATGSRTRTTARGTTSSAASVERTENGYSKDKSHTTAAGKTYGKSVDVTRDDNTWTREVTLTGPNGGTKTRQRTVTVE